jgi:GxxExxY protein
MDLFRSHEAMESNQSDLSGQIIGAAIRVHESLGPGFLEAIYEEALCIEFGEIGLKYVRQFPVKLSYRERPIGEHRLDLLVEGKIVVELKAVFDFDPIHFAIMRSYLKATGCDLGLLLNFATPTLAIKRVGREWHSRSH